jgi:mRNA-degrading endonuclease toxin of MazEF toxin-antitoxin module
MPDKRVRDAVIEVNLDPTQGHELKKKRPCVVIQNDIVVVCRQIRSVDESRITGTLGQLSKDTMLKIDNALRVSLSL